MTGADEADFTDFVRAASPELLRTAWYLTGSRSAAEELVQDTLERCYVKWSRIRPGEAHGYARRVMVNRHTDIWRRRRREVLVDAVPERPAGERESRHVDLVRALTTLTARERDVIVLRHYADQSEQQVADLLGCSVGTVKSTSSRAAAKLRTVLAEPGSRDAVPGATHA